MRIALAQLAATTDPVANLVLVRDFASRAVAQDAAVVVFPEATMCSFERPSGEVAESFDGPWADGVRAIARELGVTLVVGMFTTAADGRVHNTLLVTGGEVEARYDKIHLYDALGFTESDVIAPGTRPVVTHLDGVAVGLATCYDLRFPGLFTTLASRGDRKSVV